MSTTFLVVPSCPTCPPMGLSDFYRWDFVRRATWAGMLSLAGGVPLLLESFEGLSYFSSRMRSSRFSLSNLSVLRLSWHISTNWESTVSRNDWISATRLESVSFMSLTFFFTDIKITKIFELTKCFGIWSLEKLRSWSIFAKQENHRNMVSKRQTSMRLLTFYHSLNSYEWKGAC